VIGADTDPADIVIDIADLVGHSATYLGIDKVMNPDFLRATLGTPFSASVAKIAHQLLLFRVIEMFR
jgi:hypothetical protein